MAIPRACTCLLLLSATALPLHAQPWASERGGVWQTVDGTTIRVAYGRPAARGRTLFGELVPWEHVWTPGANNATTLEVDRDVRINGVPVAPGEYSVWVVPRERGEWTLGLDARTDRWHTQRPDTGDFVVRIPALPEPGPHVERLTFEFVELRRNQTLLQLRWGGTVVPLEVGVRSTTESEPLTAERLEPYLGEYALTIHEDGGEPETVTLVLHDADGRLRGRGGGEPLIEFVATDDPHEFLFGMLRDGELFDLDDARVTFRVEDGRATGFVARDRDGEVRLQAERVR